jgi:hypothetical protein
MHGQKAHLEVLVDASIRSKAVGSQIEAPVSRRVVDKSRATCASDYSLQAVLRREDEVHLCLFLGGHPARMTHLNSHQPVSKEVATIWLMIGRPGIPVE